jgi:hypothetical protein
LALATRSATVRTGDLALTNNTYGWVATIEIGANDVRPSYDSLEYRCGAITFEVRPPHSKVYPSGVARAALAAPMVVPAPGTFSTMKLPPVCFWKASASSRALASVAPPGA